MADNVVKTEPDPDEKLTRWEPAFPVTISDGSRVYTNFGMRLRDWFAGNMQEDDRLVKVIRAMDDSALEMYALYPDLEREEHITGVTLTDWASLPNEVAKIARRLELEARAIARVRCMQADAMMAERAHKAEEDAG